MGLADTAKMIVELDFKSGKFTSGIKQSTAGVGQLESKLGSLTKGASKLGLNLGMLGTAALGGTVVGFLADATKAGIEEEAQIARLDAALKANAKGWDGNIDAVERRIDANKKMAFSDDEMRDALTKLIPVTNNVNDAFDAQAVAMDLARLKNISLEEAASILAKAFNGQTRGLKELGIPVKDITTKVGLLAAVEEKAAGQADAFAKSHAGAAKRIGDAWADFGEEVGKNVLGAVDDLANGLSLVAWQAEEVNRLGIKGSDIHRTFAGTIDDERLSWAAYQNALAGITTVTPPATETILRLAAAEREAASAARIPIPTQSIENITLSANEARTALGKLTDTFTEATRTLRDKTLSTAYDAKRLPDEIILSKIDVVNAERELGKARTTEQKAAARIQLLDAQENLENLTNKSRDFKDDYGATGQALGDALGGKMYERIILWTGRVQAILRSMGTSVPLPKLPTIGTGGGHLGLIPAASGMPFVPYDNMPALLHRREAVLTASQADAWRSGGTPQINIINRVTATVSARDMEHAMEVRSRYNPGRRGL